MSFLVAARSASCYEDDFFLVNPVTIWICLLLSFVTICLVSSVTIRLVSSMTIFYELFWRQSLVVLCGSPLSYSELFCVLLLCFICCMGFFLSTGIFVSWTLLLFEDSTSCNSKLKVSSYCTLSLRGDVRDIYWAMRPKPSVGPLIVIEANRSS